MGYERLQITLNKEDFFLNERCFYYMYQIKFQMFVAKKSLADVPAHGGCGCLLQGRHSAPVLRALPFTFSCVLACYHAGVMKYLASSIIKEARNISKTINYIALNAS